MQTALMVGSFIFFTALVGVLTWWITRKDDASSSTGYFLAGRSLTFPLIAGSLLLTNLSTEQLVGLNADAFRDGLCVMVWEVVCVIALVFMAWFFLPRFLRSGVTTVPEYLGLRFDRQTETIANIILLVAYVGVLLPVILYSCAMGLKDMLLIPDALRHTLGWMGIAVKPTWDMDLISIWVIIWFVGTIGSIYALFGGLRTVAVSDTLNGVGLLVGGMLITVCALYVLGDNDIFAGYARFKTEQGSRLNSIGGPDTSVPFATIFSGVFLLNLFYWTTNQQIIQRTFAASSLAEGQKGVLLTGFLKLFGPLFLVVPGMIAAVMFADQKDLVADTAYGKLVQKVLPVPLTGFFAAAMFGAILSSFNSALNSSCTLFSLGIYKPLINPNATDRQTVRSSTIFGVIVAVLAMSVAPLLYAMREMEGGGIFGYLQKMNGLYFIPIFAVVLVGMVSRRVPSFAAKFALVAGCTIIAVGYFVPYAKGIVEWMNNYQFLGVVFAWLVITMFVIGELRPRPTEFEQVDVKAVDMTPWRHARLVGIGLILCVVLIYTYFHDFSAYKEKPKAKAASNEVDTPDVIAPETITDKEDQK